LHLGLGGERERLVAEAVAVVERIVAPRREDEGSSATGSCSTLAISASSASSAASSAPASRARTRAAVLSSSQTVFCFGWAALIAGVAAGRRYDVHSFAVLEPVADGFRNYLGGKYTVPSEALLVDKAQLLTLTARDDGARRGSPRPRRQRRRRQARRLHPAARRADQRLLRRPRRPRHGVEAGLEGRRRVRGARSQDRPGEVDRHARRPRLRLDRSSARSPRSTAAPTDRSGSCGTSSRPGPR